MLTVPRTSNELSLSTATIFLLKSWVGAENLVYIKKVFCQELILMLVMHAISLPEKLMPKVGYEL